MKNVVVTILRRVCYVTTWAYLTWLLSMHPGPLLVVARLLDFPAAILFVVAKAAHLPLFEGLDLCFGSNHWDFVTPAQELILHVRASVLLFVPLTFVVERAWARIRRGPRKRAR